MALFSVGFLGNVFCGRFFFFSLPNVQHGDRGGHGHGQLQNSPVRDRVAEHGEQHEAERPGDLHDERDESARSRRQQFQDEDIRRVLQTLNEYPLKAAQRQKRRIILKSKLSPSCLLRRVSS